MTTIYKECKGCYSIGQDPGGVRYTCSHINETYKECPCRKCLIKSVCNTICKDYIEVLIRNIKKYFPNIQKVQSLCQSNIHTQVLI